MQRSEEAAGAGQELGRSWPGGRRLTAREAQAGSTWVFVPGPAGDENRVGAPAPPALQGEYSPF